MNHLIEREQAFVDIPFIGATEESSGNRFAGLGLEMLLDIILLPHYLIPQGVIFSVGRVDHYRNWFYFDYKYKQN